MKPRLKLAIVVSHPIQHFTPVYQVLSESGLLDLVVIFYSDSGAREHFDHGFGVQYSWDIDLMSGYRHAVLKPGAPVSGMSFWGVDSTRLPRLLDDENPDAVFLYGYNRLLQWRARRWALRREKKILYFSDSSLTGIRQNGVVWFKNMIKSAVLKHYFRSVHCFFSVGDRNEQYLRHFGVEFEKIKRCPLSVDIKRLEVGEPSDREDIRKRVRESHGIHDGEFVVLFCGKLMPIKRPQDLLTATAKLRCAGWKVKALFAGTGPLLSELTEINQAASVQEQAVFLGFLNQTEIKRAYYASDALVVCSELDNHPLVVTEAAACGLPIICSDQVGCVGPTDTVREGINALVYPCGDETALSNCIINLINDPELARQMSAASREIAATQDVSVAAEAIFQGTYEVCGRVLGAKG